MFGGFPRLPLSNFDFTELKSTETDELIAFTKSLVTFSKNQRSLPKLSTFQSLPKFIQDEIIFSKQNKTNSLKSFHSILLLSFRQILFLIFAVNLFLILNQ